MCDAKITVREEKTEFQYFCKVQSGERNEELYQCDSKHQKYKRIPYARPCEQAWMQ